MTSAVAAYNTKLVWNYRELLEITNIAGPTQKRTMIDLTNHDSVNGYREFVPGVIEGGEITVEGNFISGDSPGQIAFHTDLQGTTIRACYLVLPMGVGAAFSFNAFAQGFDLALPVDSQVGVSGSLVVSGKPTLLTTQSAGMSGLTGIKDGGVNTGNAITIAETPAVGTYAYTCTVDADTTGVKLTITAASHTIYANGTLHTTGVQGSTLTLGASGTDTTIFIIVYESAKAPRLYRLVITRP